MTEMISKMDKEKSADASYRKGYQQGYGHALSVLDDLIRNGYTLTEAKRILYKFIENELGQWRNHAETYGDYEEAPQLVVGPGRKLTLMKIQPDDSAVETPYQP